MRGNKNSSVCATHGGRRVHGAIAHCGTVGCQKRVDRAMLAAPAFKHMSKEMRMDLEDTTSSKADEDYRRAVEAGFIGISMTGSML